MPSRARDLELWMVVKQKPKVAFATFVEDLVEGLAAQGIDFDAGPGGRIVRAGQDFGRIVAWVPGRSIRFTWRSVEWAADPFAEVLVRFVRTPSGTRISLGVSKWMDRHGDMVPEPAAWLAGQLGAPLLGALSAGALGDWVTDRAARKPSGPAARATYQDPLYHRPNFKLLLHTLSLGPGDYLLEVGCGGGAFLAEALQSGCRAAAVDHSADMVRLAREVNAEAVRSGRLILAVADASRLPYASARFTSAVMTGVFFFIPDPVTALAEIHRVLAPRGRMALFTDTKELLGTPAAPEPIASRGRFYEDEELRGIATRAGFTGPRVERPDLGPYAREAGLSRDLVAMFSGGGGVQLLTARKA